MYCLKSLLKKISVATLIFLFLPTTTILAQQSQVQTAVDTLIAAIKDPGVLTNERFKSDVIENAKKIDEQGTQQQIQQVTNTVKAYATNVQKVLQNQFLTAFNNSQVIESVKTVVQPGLSQALTALLYTGLESQLNKTPLVQNAVKANGLVGITNGIANQKPVFKEYLKLPKPNPGVLINGIATMARDAFNKTIQSMGGAKNVLQQQFGQLNILPSKLSTQELAVIKQNSEPTNWITSQFNLLVTNPTIKKEFVLIAGNALMGGLYGAAFAFLGLTPDILMGTANLPKTIITVAQGFADGALNGAARGILYQAAQLAEYKPNLGGEAAIAINSKVLASGSQIPSLGTLAVTGLTTLGIGAITELVQKNNISNKLLNWFSLDLPPSAFEMTGF